MLLHDALRAIAQQFNLDANELTAYAAFDPHDGWDEGRGSWSSGSVWTVEGRVLYALVRALKPQRVIEFGTADGCSATHIAEALRANGDGSLTCVDKNDWAGRYIPDDLRDLIRSDVATVEERLKADRVFYDFVYEDSDHTAETVGAVWKWARQHVTHGGAVISHDAVHPAIGHLVKAGIEQSGAQGVRYYPLTPAPQVGATQTGQGFAIWRQDGQVEEAPEQRAEVEQPKRPAKKAKATRSRKRAAKNVEPEPAPDERAVGTPEREPAPAATAATADTD
jgi:predicted O-methyltransferase YrrM